MSKFLSAAFIIEQVNEIDSVAKYVKGLLDLTQKGRAELMEFYLKKGYNTSFETELGASIDAILEKTHSIQEFFSSLNCDPLVWTGSGTTNEVINALEELLADKELTGS